MKILPIKHWSYWNSSFNPRWHTRTATFAGTTGTWALLLLSLSHLTMKLLHGFWILIIYQISIWAWALGNPLTCSAFRLKWNHFWVSEKKPTGRGSPRKKQVGRRRSAIIQIIYLCLCRNWHFPTPRLYEFCMSSWKDEVHKRQSNFQPGNFQQQGDHGWKLVRRKSTRKRTSLDWKNNKLNQTIHKSRIICYKFLFI